MHSNFGGLNLENSYVDFLDSNFYSFHEPDFEDQAKIIYLNLPLLEELKLDKDFFSSKEGENLLLGRVKVPNLKFFAQSYAGHQFGNFVKLGDGRALMLGEHLNSLTGKRVDLQWKGSGSTTYSRGGDGKAAMGPMLRELLVSEYLHALNIPTTRVLCVIATGEKILRNKILNGSAIIRVAESHLRVGSFEYAAAFTPIQSKVAFLHYAIRRHSSTFSNSSLVFKKSDPTPSKKDVRLFFEEVIQRQIQLISQWMSYGFIHGVMNTDNMSIAGESIDFGPCAFMNQFHPTEVFSSIDRHGRYAYMNQPSIAIWNLTRFAEAILEFLGDTESESIDYAQNILRKSNLEMTSAIDKIWMKKIGFDEEFLGKDELKKIAVDLKDNLNRMMQESEFDFTNTFRALCEPSSPLFEKLFSNPKFSEWFKQWKQFQTQILGKDIEDIQQNLSRINPRYIPRNMVVQNILDRAENSQDLSEFLSLLKIIQNPFEVYAGNSLASELVDFSTDEKDFVSFCGT